MSEFGDFTWPTNSPERDSFTDDRSRDFDNEPDEASLLPMGPTLTDDFLKTKEISDRVVEHWCQEADDRVEQASEPYSNVTKSAFDGLLIVAATLKDLKVPVAITDNALDSTGRPVSNSVQVSWSPDHNVYGVCRTVKDTKLIAPYRWQKAADFEKAVQPGTTPYTRLAGTLQYDGNYIQPNAVNPSSGQYNRYRSLAPEWTDDEFKATFPRFFMACVLAEYIEKPYFLTKERSNSYFAAPKFTMYEKLAEAGFKPITIEQYHGIISGAIRKTLEEQPELLEQAA